MCNYCGCREFPLIGRLTAEHEAIEETAGLLRRAIVGGREADAFRLLDELLELLLPHTATEESGLFAELRAEGSLNEAVDRLCAEHADIHGVLRSVDGTAPDWPAVVAALARLRRHIDNEEHGLFPAAVIALPIPAWDRITVPAPATAGARVGPATMTPTYGPRGGTRTLRHDAAERPFIVIWEATQACPLACRHCRATARPQRDPAELTTAEAMDLMVQVAEFGRPAPLFVITGGDPFQRPDLHVLIRHGSQLALAVSVSPSGTPTLTREAIVDLHAAGARAISLSLDAATAESHDGFRGVAGVYGWTVEAWRTAIDVGLKVQINTTVTADNVLDLPEIAAQVRDRGAMLWSVFFLVPTGRGRALAGLDAAQTEDVLNALYDLGENVPVKTTEAHHFRRVCLQRAIIATRGASPRHVLGLGPLYDRLRHRLEELSLVDRPRRVRRPPLQVSAGRGFVFVSHRGEVHPSGFLPLGAGNVRHQRLADIYRTTPLFTGLRDPDRLGGRCGHCEFRTVCGGSRARAYAVTGDVFAEESACGYQPGTFPYPDDLAPLLAGRG